MPSCSFLVAMDPDDVDVSPAMGELVVLCQFQIVVVIDHDQEQTQKVTLGPCTLGEVASSLGPSPFAHIRRTTRADSIVSIDFRTLHRHLSVLARSLRDEDERRTR